jgi:hypothetical protein
MRGTTTAKSRRGLPLLLAVLCASCAQVEADVPEAQVTQKGVAFHGTGGWGTWPGEVSALQSFVLSSDNLSWVKDLNSKIYVTQVDLRAASGVDDLSFIHYAHVTIADAENMWKPVEIVDYMRPDNQGPTPLLTAKTLHPVDVTEVWRAKKVVVSIALAGELPSKPWKADVTLHLSGKISYKL